MGISNEAFIEKIKKDSYKGFNAIEYADGGMELYLSFKALLEWTNINVNLFSDDTEVIKIDFESNKPMFMYSTSISANLQKCYIRNQYLHTTQGTLNSSTSSPSLPSSFGDIDKFDGTEYNSLKSELTKSGEKASGTAASKYIYPYIGNINNIYLNAAFISEQLHKLSDNESNKVSIREFLQGLCNGVNKALGSINDLQVIGDVDGEQNILTIVDFQQVRIKNLVSNLSIDKRKTATIQAQGLKSMVTNISAQSTITPDLATVISIGAQANGEALGEEAVSFSRLSKGLTDRIYPTKQISVETKEKQEERREKKAAKTEENFRESLITYAKLVKNQQPNSTDFFGPVKLETVDKAGMENTPVELYKYLLGKFTHSNQTNTGFIPIKLDISIYGMSGIKIFQKFKITDDVLPFSYDQKYDFTITGVSHTVDNSKWVTNISSVMGLEPPPDKGAEDLTNETFAPELVLDGTGDNGTGTVVYVKRVVKFTVGTEEIDVTNGEVPDEYMRELNQTLFPYSKWKSPSLKSDGGRVRLLKPVMANLEKMLTAYAKDNPNIPLLINSAFRTYAKQLELKNLWTRKGKPTNAATPGQSEHGFGRAIDFGNASGAKLEVAMSQYKWLKVNAGKYGFKRLPNWKDKGDLENWEAWHWQDVRPTTIDV